MTERRPVNRAGPRRLLLVAAWLLLGAGALHAADPLPPPPQSPEAWLVTYGPGEIYWQRFGHNAVWLRDPRDGLDHTINFGYFDFEQENFLLRFVMGRPEYFSHAQRSANEFAQYRAEGREIRMQRLDLTPAQFDRLRNALLTAVQPEHRYYRYDYYLDNCSTRVRDELDAALGGALQSRFRERPAGLDFRAQTRRLTAMDPWLYLGLMTGLGHPVDRPVSRWDEFFIPMELADAMPGVRATDGGPLVLDERVIAEAMVPAPPERPPAVWLRYFAWALLALAGAWALARFTPLRARHAVNAWWLLSGLAGLFLALVWALTDHWAAGWNANLLLLNPLWLVALRQRWRRPVAWLVVAGVLLAVIQQMVPGGQYQADLIALAAPLGLAAAAWSLRKDRSAGGFAAPS